MMRPPTLHSAERTTVHETTPWSVRAVDLVFDAIELRRSAAELRKEKNFTNSIQTLFSELQGYILAFGIEDIADEQAVDFKAGPIGETGRPEGSIRARAHAGVDEEILPPRVGIVFHSGYTGIGHGSKEVTIDVGLDDARIVIADEEGSAILLGPDNMDRAASLCRDAAHMVHKVTGEWVAARTSTGSGTPAL